MLYATVSTADSVFIIGGITYGNEADGSSSISSSISQYKDDTWSMVGNLQQPRYRHTATLLEQSKIMIIGGVVSDEFL